jgi:hypothetical protein
MTRADDYRQSNDEVGHAPSLLRGRGLMSGAACTQFRAPRRKQPSARIGV